MTIGAEEEKKSGDPCSQPAQPARSRSCPKRLPIEVRAKDSVSKKQPIRRKCVQFYSDYQN